MARANRHYLPEHVWHITHRCHQQEFLLKFSKDRKSWLHWLFEAKKRFGACANGRQSEADDECYVLKEPGLSYNFYFTHEKDVLSE